MTNPNSHQRLWVAVLVSGLISGCAAAIACRPGDSTVDCCIKKYPLSPLENCTATPADVIRVLRDVSLIIKTAEEAENSTDFPEWKQACINNYVRCVDERWEGPCYDCIRLCEGQQRWSSDLCRPRK
jgi:hypothetical protein